MIDSERDREIEKMIESERDREIERMIDSERKTERQREASHHGSVFSVMAAKSVNLVNLVRCTLEISAAH